MSKKDEKKTVDILKNEENINEENENKKSDKKEKSELKVLREENERLAKENSELNTKYLLALAEQQNYKKRMDDEQSKFYKYSTFNMCREIVSVLDNLDLALDKEQKDEAIQAYLSGFKMVRNSLFSILSKEGVTEVESLGKEFDPNYMTSISVVTMEGKADNEVVQVFQKGYMYKDRVLRPAMVVVNQVKEEETKTQTETE